MKDTHLEKICEILATYLTHSKIDKLLSACSIKNISQKTITTEYGYYCGSNKRDKLFNSLKETTDSYIYIFIEKVVDPVLFTDMSKREEYQNLVEELNTILSFDGKEINSSGKIVSSTKVSTLNEVDRRVNSLKRHLYDRKIHNEVTKYCNEDLLKKDYYEAVFEASKGLAERVRILTGLTTDGTELFETSLKSNPDDTYLFFNSLKTKSERSEQNGLKELLNAIFHLVRNPQAHIPKINWPIEEDKALDILTLISFAHKYLDLCNKMPGK